MNWPKMKGYNLYTIYKLPVDIISFICVHTKYFNKASFYLQDGQYYIDIEVNLIKEL